MKRRNDAIHRRQVNRPTTKCCGRADVEHPHLAERPFRKVEDLTHPLNDLPHPVEDLRHPVNRLRRPIKRLRHPVERLRHPVEGVRHPVNRLRHPVKRLRHPVKRLRHPVVVLVLGAGTADFSAELMPARGPAGAVRERECRDEMTKFSSQLFGVGSSFP
ncbi:MAG: hypothetical protein WCF18_22805 [Chthoniobacteraceae bacterium]